MFGRVPGKGYSSTYLAMRFANVRAGTQMISSQMGAPLKYTCVCEKGWRGDKCHFCESGLTFASGCQSATTLVPF